MLWKLRSGRAAIVTGAMLILTSCGGPTNTAEIKPAPVPRQLCSAWEPMTWSRQDTDDTIRQIKAHNAVGESLKCW